MTLEKRLKGLEGLEKENIRLRNALEEDTEHFQTVLEDFEHVEKSLKNGISQLEKENEKLKEKVFRLEEGYLVARIERDDYSEMFYDTLRKLNRMENLSNCPDHELLGMHTRIESEMYRRKLVKNTNLGGNVNTGIKRILYPCTCPDCLQGEQLEDHDLYVTYENGNIINMEGRKIK